MTGNPYHDAKGLFAAGPGGSTADQNNANTRADEVKKQLRKQLLDRPDKSMARQATAKAKLLRAKGKPPTYSKAGSYGKPASGTKLGRSLRAEAKAARIEAMPTFRNMPSHGPKK